MNERDDKLLQQFHFYFSDSNLAKDKFLKEIITDNPDGWVPLATFMTFNKVKQLVKDTTTLSKVLENSAILELNEDKSEVRRRSPYQEKKISVDNVIYVEHLPLDWDHEMVKSLFKEFGTVDYVSLPRDRKTRQFMGFGFVEFSSAKEAVKALALNGYSETAWKDPLVVISKKAWEEQKRKYRKPEASAAIQDIPVPLYVSHIPDDATVKSIRNLFSMFGPVLYISLWNEESQLLARNTCIVEFASTICAERCLYYLKHFKQCMIPGEALEARRLSQAEQSLYYSSHSKSGKTKRKRSLSYECDGISNNESDSKIRKTEVFYVCNKQDKIYVIFYDKRPITHQQREGIR